MDRSISNLRLVAVLVALHTKGRGAVVRLARGRETKQIVVRKGCLAFAESTAPEEHLARILLKKSLLEKKDLQTIAGLMKAGKTSEEAILEGTGLDELSLEEGVRQQAVTILASTLAWKGVEPKLYAAEDAFGRRVTLQIPLPEALVMAARHAVSERLISLPPNASNKTILPGDLGWGMDFPLDHLEAHAYSQVHGPIPVENLIPLFLPGVEPEGLLLRLLALGMLRIQSARGTTRTPVSESTLESRLSEELDELLSRTEVANHYEVLSVQADASAEEIKAAYHEMAKKFHPDRFESQEFSPGFRSNVEKLFTHITGAYTTLINPASRALYDESRKKDSQVEAAVQARSGADTEKEKMADALWRSGCAAIASGDYERAVRHIKESVWLCPDDARYHHYLGIAQSEIPKFRKEAEQSFVKAISIDRTRLDTYLELGKLYLRVNLFKRATAQFEEVLRWDPDNPSAQRLLKQIRSGVEDGSALVQRKMRRGS